MAYTNLAVETASIGGLNPSYTAATLTDGNMFTNSGKEFVHVVNGSGGSINVTVLTPALVRGLTLEDKVVAVPAGEERMIGRFDPGLYNQSGTDAGKVYVQFSSVTSVTVGVFR